MNSWLALLLVVAAFQSPVNVPVSPASQGQPRDPTKPVTGTGSISGRVYAGDTGVPMRRTQVMVSGMGAPKSTYTDQEGRYTLTGLPAGNFTVTVNPGPHRAGYLSAAYGSPMMGVGRGSSGRGKMIELADGQRVENIDIPLIRGGAITGIVTDGSGDPVARVQVTAMLARRGSDPMMVGGAQTDDLGQFRIFGLQPGDYMVSADARGMGGGPQDVQGEVIGFASTFAPGTASPAEAMRVRVSRGGQASADIRLVETRVYSIRGTVISSSGEPVKNASVMLSRPDLWWGGGMGYGSGMMPDGTFVIRNVPPGQYDLLARHMPPADNPAAAREAIQRQEVATARVDVGGADLEGITLVTQRGAVVVGQIVFEDGPAEGRRVQIYTQTAERRSSMGSAMVEVTDSTFTMRNAFGPLLVRGSVVSAQGRPAEGTTESWGLKAVMLGGRDITDEARTFSDADSGKLQVVFTSQAPGLDGVVVDDAGKPLQDCTIVIFGEDRATWRPGSSMIRSTRPMKEGRYRFRGLREGRYRVVALPPDFMLNPMMVDPELLEALSKLASPVLLNAGETRTLDLKLTPFEQ